MKLLNNHPQHLFRFDLKLICCVYNTVRTQLACMSSMMPAIDELDLQLRKCDCESGAVCSKHKHQIINDCIVYRPTANVGITARYDSTRLYIHNRTMPVLCTSAANITCLISLESELHILSYCQDYGLHCMLHDDSLAA